MGYFVRKTALGLKPINHTVEDEATVYETDGYCMSPGEYIEIQKILSSQKEKIARLQIEKEQEESEILDYYKNAFKKMKKEYSAKLTCEIQSFREKYSQPLIVQKEQLLMAENQIQTLKDKLEVSNVYALERENLNKNLLRIMKERANADREILLLIDLYAEDFLHFESSSSTVPIEDPSVSVSADSSLSDTPPEAVSKAVFISAKCTFRLSVASVSMEGSPLISYRLVPRLVKEPPIISFNVVEAFAFMLSVSSVRRSSIDCVSSVGRLLFITSLDWS